MKKQLLTFTLLLSVAFAAQAQSKIDKEKIKEEIRVAESDFQKDLRQNGPQHAFYLFADKNAVIKRENDTLVIGNEAIRNYYANPAYKGAVAEWKPDFIDVSEDGTMAYTYGKFTWKSTGKDGKTSTYSGVFHTVWKRNSEGKWKYVWD